MNNLYQQVQLTLKLTWLNACKTGVLNSHTISFFFWAHLAPCHYSRSAKEFYEEKGILVVSREKNPPNGPVLRPMERYWAQIKRKLKNIQFTVSDFQFRRKRKQASGSMSEMHIEKLMSGISRKVRLFCSSWIICLNYWGLL